MKPLQSLRMSWRTIRGHPLRSILTVLGVVIGVAAVITFVTLGASLQEDILVEVGSEEASNVYVWTGPEDTDQGGPGFGAEPVFTTGDVGTVDDLASVESAIPYTIWLSESIQFRGQTVTRQDALRVTAPDYVTDEEFEEGGPFEVGAEEAVLTPGAAAMFETNVTVGETITVNTAGGPTNLTVVGILESDESLSPAESFSTTPRIYTSPEVFDASRFLFLIVDAGEPTSVDAAKEDTLAYLNDESDAKTSLPENYVFELQTAEDLLSQIKELLDLLTGFVTGIALISLVVGAIGIANIMLVSVTERTREIGIMKAVGAQNRDVLQLFLTEAVILGLIGAILGTILGAVVGFAATEVIGIDTYVFPSFWAGVAVLVGIAVGVVAGLYPAWNAAKTDPIDALRYE
ncbi:MAG: putative ABC transport system permease protein [Halobacteriales archaeon]|jgi:putative ABC transport system permease protein